MTISDHVTLINEDVLLTCWLCIWYVIEEQHYHLRPYITHCSYIIYQWTSRVLGWYLYLWRQRWLLAFRQGTMEWHRNLEGSKIKFVF